MQAVAAIRAISADNDFGGTPCPKCSTPVGEPKSSEYRGLGRIEHSWQCASCGAEFGTTARMAGVADFEPETVTVAAA